MKKKFKLWRRGDRIGRYYVQFLHSPGKWHSANTTDKDHAEEWAYLNLKPEPEKVTLRLFSEAFFVGDSQGWVARQHARGRTLTQKHLTNCDACLRNHILPQLGNMMIQSLEIQKVENCLLKRRQSVTSKNKTLHPPSDFPVHPLSKINQVLRFAGIERESDRFYSVFNDVHHFFFGCEGFE